MSTTEHTINDALALVLRQGRQAWRDAGIVRSENTGMLLGAGGRPDILVLEPYVSPVVIETEVFPATTVEPEARSRLGISVAQTGRSIFSSIAVRMPKRLRALDGSDLAKELTLAADFEMALFTGESPAEALRWPRNQWIKGSIRDLSLLTQAASVPPEVIDRAADELTNGIRATAGLYAEVLSSHPGSMAKIADELRQESGEQTWRMAAAILANAFVFHESLAGGPGDLRDVRSLEELRSDGDLTKAGLLTEWAKVLKVNYWSIFDIARRILEHTPGSVSKALVVSLATTAARLLEHRLMRSHDLTGAVFQRLIADRKFLAAYYTTPPSAALLAGLAIREEKSPAETPWSDTEALRDLRVADFACGTGTLLSAAYQRISQLHELAGGDARVLHRHMMGGSLVGCDVLPAAAHLTAASLSSVHPTETYTESSIITLAFGRQPGGGVSLGSWDLLDAQKPFEILGITAKAAQGTGEKTIEPWSSLPHGGFDLVIMNPPFTRPTGHEAGKIGVRNPMFAAFATDDATQKIMGKVGAKLSAGTNYHGNAGEGSIFLALADKKLKVGGTLAMVLPLSLMLGEAWEASRQLLVDRYEDLILVTNAGIGGRDMSFSSDTDMGECLVVGRRGGSTKRATFVTLNERPDTTMTGANIANQIRHLVSVGQKRQLEDGPVGGVPLVLGNELVGHVLDAPIEEGWKLARVRDFAVAQAAYSLCRGTVHFPGTSKHSVLELPMTTVGILGSVGPYHADINGRTSTGGIRGPFDKREIGVADVPTYPLLWEHDADRERTISFEADTEGVVRLGADSHEQEIIDVKLERIWNSASHCHFNRDFRFNSQSTSMQFTRRLTMGGRAWTSIKLASVKQEMALVLWSNTTLGMLCYWWHANKQQAGRGSIGKTALESLSALDVAAFSADQLETCERLFDEFAYIRMRPLNELHIDVARHTLDHAFLHQVLGFPAPVFSADGPLHLLRQKLSHEPSVAGQKRVTR